MAHYLRSCGTLSDELAKEYAAQADEKAADLRGRMSRGTPLDPVSLFDHVYQNPTGQLQEQRAVLQAELQQENR